MLNLWIRT